MVSSKHSLFIIAAKTDLSEKEAIQIKEASEFANSCGATLHQTSAKEGTGVYELFQAVADKLYTISLAGDFELPAANSRSRVNATQSFRLKGNKKAELQQGMDDGGSAFVEKEKKSGCCWSN